MSGVRHPVYAVLVAEDEIHHVNAGALWAQGLKVGHLSRANACLYRPGLLGLQRRYGQPVALNGVIAGWGSEKTAQDGSVYFSVTTRRTSACEHPPSFRSPYGHDED